MDARSMLEAVFGGNDRPFAVRLWDGTELSPAAAGGAPALVLTSERAAGAIGIPPSEERMAEAYLAGDLEVEGSLVDFLERASIPWDLQD